MDECGNYTILSHHPPLPTTKHALDMLKNLSIPSSIPFFQFKRSTLWGRQIKHSAVNKTSMQKFKNISQMLIEKFFRPTCRSTRVFNKVSSYPAPMGRISFYWYNENNKRTKESSLSAAIKNPYHVYSMIIKYTKLSTTHLIFTCIKIWKHLLCHLSKETTCKKLENDRIMVKTMITKRNKVLRSIKITHIIKIVEWQNSESVEKNKMRSGIKQ